MKHTINSILAALILASAMSIIPSCQKDENNSGFGDYYIDLKDWNNRTVDLSEEGDSQVITLRTNIPFERITAFSDAEWLRIESIHADSQNDISVRFSSPRNETNTVRTATLSFSDKEAAAKTLRVTASQSYVLIQRDDVVSFADKPFMEYMLSLADRDGDLFISFEEALDVKEIDIEGLGVKDISGLEHFKNVWKFNGRNNDIEDATVLKELPRLYWMDLKGNKNLKTFDLTGCSVYFEHKDFEMTEDLHYFMTRQQIQKYQDTADWGATKSKHVIDPRESTDFSRQGELTLIKEHTVGDGYPIVYTVWGAIDVDVNDGTYERLVRDAMDLQFEFNPVITKYTEYFDVYMLIHIRPNRNEYKLGSEMTDQERGEAIDWVIERQTAIYDEIYDRLVPEGSGICKMLMSFLCLNTTSAFFNAYNTSVKSWNTMDPGSDKGIFTLYNINRKTGDEAETSYSLYSKTCLKQIVGDFEFGGYYKDIDEYGRMTPGWPYGPGEYFDVFMLGTKHYDRPW